LFDLAVWRLLFLRSLREFDAARAWEEQTRIIAGMARSSEPSRALITMLCDHLQHLKGRRPRFADIAKPFTNDSYVLLEDATQMFCRAVSEAYGEEPTRRWNDFLPEFLLLHPERCDEVLGLIEQKHFQAPRYLEMAGSSQ
jgi:hypothetical protein